MVGELCQVLYGECRRDPSHGLTYRQEQLVGVVCRLPDLLANRMGHQLHHSLLPREYFTALGRSMLACLEQVHRALRGGCTHLLLLNFELSICCGATLSLSHHLSDAVLILLPAASEDCALVFPAAVVGKAALLGHKGALAVCHIPLSTGHCCLPHQMPCSRSLFLSWSTELQKTHYGRGWLGHCLHESPVVA